jgi:hypothetical protein
VANPTERFAKTGSKALETNEQKMDIADESGFEPLVPVRSQHNRGIGPISPIASIRVPLVMPLANSISISVASGTSDSNPPSSSDSLERTW